MRIDYHPAPGLEGRLGTFMGAKFTMPQNPLRPNSPLVRAERLLDTVNRLKANPNKTRTRNALVVSMQGMGGCSGSATPVMQTATGQVQAEENGETPLWVHITVGGIITAIVLGAMGKR